MNNPKEIHYKNLYLQRGSVAYDLYQDSKIDKLDKHLKEIQEKYFKLLKELKE